jgi:hypothetical protein
LVDGVAIVVVEATVDAAVH